MSLPLPPYRIPTTLVTAASIAVFFGGLLAGHALVAGHSLAIREVAAPASFGQADGSAAMAGGSPAAPRLTSVPCAA